MSLLSLPFTGYESSNECGTCPFVRRIDVLIEKGVEALLDEAVKRHVATVEHTAALVCFHVSPLASDESGQLSISRVPLTGLAIWRRGPTGPLLELLVVEGFPIGILLLERRQDDGLGLAGAATGGAAAMPLVHARLMLAPLAFPLR